MDVKIFMKRSAMSLSGAWIIFRGVLVSGRAVISDTALLFFMVSLFAFIKPGQKN